MSVVLITGSCGLVGSESVDFFSKKGFDIAGIDNNLRQFFFVGPCVYVPLLAGDAPPNVGNYVVFWNTQAIGV